MEGNKRLTGTSSGFIATWSNWMLLEVIDYSVLGFFSELVGEIMNKQVVRTV